MKLGTKKVRKFIIKDMFCKSIIYICIVVIFGASFLANINIKTTKIKQTDIKLHALEEGKDEGKDDIESEFLSSIDMLLEIMEKDEELSDEANTMKYIYYRYTKDENYKTELDFSAFNINDFTKNSENISVDDLIVKTDEKNAAPLVPKEKLRQGLKNWVSGNQQSNALKVLDKVIECEQKYKLNAVFIYALLQQECSIGTANTSWVRENNWMSLTSLGHIQYTTPQENIDRGCRNISKGKYYFRVGKYSLYQIGATYCADPPPPAWANGMKEKMVALYKACGVDIDSISTGGNQEIIKIARSKKGCPYAYGAKGPDSFDCSGFVYWVYKQKKISVPGSTDAYKPYKNSKKEIKWDQAQPGDILVVFNSERGTANGHAGIYLGDDKYIHAPQTGDVVKESKGAKSRFKHVFRFY